MSKIRHTFEVNTSTLLIMMFVKTCLEEGVEFYCQKENLYPASVIFRALLAGKDIDIVFPEKKKK
jgi:hypothetical protein